MREFTSLDLQQRSAVDEALPSELAKPHAIVRRGALKDPLGYDTADLRQVATDMADAAESGRNRAAVRAEIAAVERRMGLLAPSMKAR
jgi:hypothetical protein